jgi:branched-chain amino acid aminotransferase
MWCAPVLNFGLLIDLCLALAPHLQAPYNESATQTIGLTFARVIEERIYSVMDKMPKYAFFEGKVVPIEEAKVSVMIHGLNYGTAAFGGIRGYWSAEEEQLFIFRPLDHFTRLLGSAKMLMMNLDYSAEQLKDILVDLLRTEGFRENVYVRPLAYKSALGIGVRLHDIPDAFTMFAFPYGTYLATSAPAKVGVSAWRRVDDTMIPARGKISGAYVNSALAKSDAVLSGFDEALVLTQDGHVSEASAANFFIIRNGKAITPPISDNILEGITRRTVITLLEDVLSVPVVERSIDRTELYLADEAFFCGTGIQIAAVGSIDHRPVGNGEQGPVVTRLTEVFHRVVTGAYPDYRHWLEPVFAKEPVSGSL